jgi:NADP-reducing hydrogenase subunit HndB
MRKLKSVEDLHALRKQLQDGIDVGKKTSTTITVGMGTCGLSAGARQVMDAIEQELSTRGIDANVRTVGCIGMCSKEPLVDIQQGDEPRVAYGEVTPKMVPRIILEHLVEGKVVEEWAVGRIDVGGEA